MHVLCVEKVRQIIGHMMMLEMIKIMTLQYYLSLSYLSTLMRTVLHQLCLF